VWEGVGGWGKNVDEAAGRKSIRPLGILGAQKFTCPPEAVIPSGIRCLNRERGKRGSSNELRNLESC
jgi:hypothetical protein